MNWPVLYFFNRVVVALRYARVRRRCGAYSDAEGHFRSLHSNIDVLAERPIAAVVPAVTLLDKGDSPRDSVNGTDREIDSRTRITNVCPIARRTRFSVLGKICLTSLRFLFYCSTQYIRNPGFPPKYHEDYRFIFKSA